ncbi:hypothetical protein LNV08_22030 [Paucibacter sp. TC2R-5]|uniref:hypothetical protein n=1 Tax=Paucibacter sp. TC2R-5 TaxID=2893555 RepID=UPI0021E4923B|nr:hypothetical protein [Paucibacter sp. TC2R-5]MCV2361653.1 hypothetical protein [Paucibacter sp. TC2R-5]
MANGIAAGAQAGAAFGPWGAAVGGALGAATDMASAAMGGPFMGGTSHATYGDVDVDHSGWSVNVGSGSATTDNAQTKTKRKEQAAVRDQFAQGIGYGPPWADDVMPAAPMQAGMNNYAIFFLGGAALVMLIKRMRK